MAFAANAHEYQDDLRTAPEETNTQIVAIINRLDSTISLHVSSTSGEPITVWPGQTAGCQLRLDACADGHAPDGEHDHQYIEVRIRRHDAAEARFWLWQADGQIKFSRRAPHDPRASTVPGNAITGGDRVLTIDDGSHRDGGLWGAIRRQVWQTTGWSSRGRTGLQRPAGRLE